MVTHSTPSPTVSAVHLLLKCYYATNCNEKLQKPQIFKTIEVKFSVFLNHERLVLVKKSEKLRKVIVCLQA